MKLEASRRLTAAVEYNKSTIDRLMSSTFGKYAKREDIEEDYGIISYVYKLRGRPQEVPIAIGNGSSMAELGKILNSFKLRLEFLVISADTLEIAVVPTGE